MIDLHTHTNESDGTDTPAELVAKAAALGLEALAISDHDTFAGHDLAIGPAAAAGLELVCAIELSARMTNQRRNNVHLLGYFLHQPPSLEFRNWLEQVLAGRRERNAALVDRLHSMGVKLELAEVERVGRTLTGRPHFARILVDKGYAVSAEDAFRKYLGDSSPGYVERAVPEASIAIQKIASSGGLAVLAHPGRLGIRDIESEDAVVEELSASGLGGIEVYHSDHRQPHIERYLGLALKYRLQVTGGSDYHGGAKPNIALGRGIRGNLSVPRSVLENMRSANE